VDDAERALDLGAADIVCVKPGRIGISASVDVHDLATDRGVAVKATGLLESGVGRAHTVAVGTLPGVTFHDLCTSTWYFTRDVVRPGWALENGMIIPPMRPGVGVEVDDDALDSVAIRRKELG
ncbi:MAG: o-succinylbenzoate synthase, partial [Acidimicrobiia bacterium]|nr:o-succinylbenzoate synthase [Acidimicrobiia bacterium]